MQTVTADELRVQLEKHAGDSAFDFINVCTPEEYSEGHIPGVRNVPLDQLEGRIGEFRDKSAVYVHCRSGRRGASAAEILESAGVEAEVFNVEGGILAWAESGGEVKKA